jgi:3-dehydroquinate dehydratase-2
MSVAARQPLIFVLNGPNLNLLGTREPHIYGNQTLENLRDLCVARANALHVDIDFRQSNHEGVIVDWLHEARIHAAAVVLNAGALTHTSIALHDAIKALDIPVIETHLSNPATREAFRHTSYVGMAAVGSIAGFGPLSYILALEAAALLAARRAAT